MSTNDSNPLLDDVSSAPALPARRSALLGPQEGGWAGGSDLAGPSEPGTPGISPSAYLHGLRRHWVLATALGLLCAVVAGVATWFGWGPQYTARAYFQIATREPMTVFPIVGAEDERFVEGAFKIYKDTQAQYVKSARVLTAALRDRDVSSLSIVQREKNNPIQWLQDELLVTFPGDAELMEVSLTDNDWRKGKEVAKLVNAVVDAYWRVVVEAERKRRNDRLSGLDNVYVEKHQLVRDKMAELRQLAKSVGTDDPEALKLRQQMAVRQIADTQGQYSQSRILLERARGELEGQRTLLANLNTVPIPQLDVEDYVNRDELMKQLAGDLAGQLMARNQTRDFVNPASSSRYVRKYDTDVTLIEDEMTRLKTGVEVKLRDKMRSGIETKIRELEVQVQVLDDQEKRIAEELAQQEKGIEGLSTSSIDLEMMRGEIDRLDVVLTTVHEKREKMRVELDTEPRITLWDRAQEPETESKWEIRVALTVLATLFGLCLPIGGIAWWDTRAERINSQADVSRRLGLTVLGSVPEIPARAIRQLRSSSKRHQAWHLRLTESIDGIAARLLRQADVDQTRVILISSAASGEGKTTLATQLAMSLARSGRRTALVDFDLRRPAFDKVLGLPLEPGVSEVLRGQNSAQDVVHETGTQNLYVVTAGRWDRHALTALANGAAGLLLDVLRAEYEFVVVDAAPILPVADTRFVSQHVDTVILSVFRDVSRAPKIEAACEILEAFGVGCVEAVVTGPTDDLSDRDLRYKASLPA